MLHRGFVENHDSAVGALLFLFRQVVRKDRGLSDWCSAYEELFHRNGFRDIELGPQPGHFAVFALDAVFQDGPAPGVLVPTFMPSSQYLPWGVGATRQSGFPKSSVTALSGELNATSGSHVMYWKILWAILPRARRGTGFGPGHGR